MPAPAFIFGFLLATLYGSSVHFVFGGDARRLALFLLSGWIGFAIGQTLGDLFDISVLNVGILHVIPASFGAFVALFVVWIMTRREVFL